MKRILRPTALAAVLILSACGNTAKHGEAEMSKNDSLPAATAEKDHTAVNNNEAMPDSAAQMKAWMDYKTPGAMHEMMAAMDGKWNSENVSYMDGKPGPSEKATMENRMLMDGLYQESVYKGSMMGMPFEGRGLLAYDNAKKKFINVWVDNMGSGVLVMEGDYNESTKTLDLKGKMTDPATGKDCEMRQVQRMTDGNHMVMELYDNRTGQEQKVMESKMVKK